MKKKTEFNGYSFDNKEMRRKMKFIIISNGDLDLNNAYAFSSMRELKKYLKEYRSWREPKAVFAIKDLTKELL